MFEVKKKTFLVLSLTVVLGTVSNTTIGEPTTTSYEHSRSVPVRNIEEDYPYVVHMEQIGNSIICVGIIVTPSFVLTSANCVKNFSHSSVFNFTISAGVNSTNSYKSVRQVKEIRLHPNYAIDRNNNTINNLAMIKTVVPFELTSTIRVAELIGRKVKLDKVAGKLIKWEKDPRTNGFHKDMRAYDVKIHSPEDCGEIIGGQSMLGYDQICATQEGFMNGPCLWDSGAPLVLKNRVIGILSDFSDTTEECDEWFFKPAVYTTIYPHQQWIKDLSTNDFDFIKLGIIVVSILLLIPLLLCFCMTLCYAFQICFSINVRGGPVVENAIY